MMSTFFKRLLLARQVSFKEGEIKILDRSFYMLPIFDIIAFQHESNKKFGGKITQMLYENGRVTAESTVAHLKKIGVKKGRLLEIWLNWVNMYGIAYLEIIHTDEKKSEVKLRSKVSSFATEYLKRFGKQKTPVDYILAGAIAGFFSKYYGKELKCEEVSCIAKGEKNCQFIVKTR